MTFLACLVVLAGGLLQGCGQSGSTSGMAPDSDEYASMIWTSDNPPSAQSGD